MHFARILRAGWPLVLASLCLGTGRASAGAEDALGRSLADLDAPSWATRRTAERTLEAEGLAVLLQATEEGPGRVRAAAFSAAIDAGLASGRPAVECALRRLLLRLESNGDATDDRVRRMPRLLRLRVERLAPQVVDRVDEDGPPLRDRRGRAGRFGIPRGDPVAAGALRGLLPEAHPVLVDVVATTTDPRRLAGAIAVLGGETGAGPTDAAALDALVGVAHRDPWLAGEVRRYEAHDRTYPVAQVALALALAGEAGLVPELLRDAPQAAQGSAVDLVRRRLPAIGAGDVAQHDEFLDRAFQGRVTARDAGEAARRALEAGLPWIARLEARRGLFLDGTDATCRAALVASAVALGLGETARAEAQGAVEVPTSVPARDDERAKAADALLREGSFGRRLVWRIEAGDSVATGLVPLAIAHGLLAFGNTIGDVAVVPVATGESRHLSYSTSRGIPRSVAFSGPYVAAVSSRGDLVVWRVTEDDMSYEPTKEKPGKVGLYAAVAGAAGEGGSFVLAAKDGRLFLVSPGGEPRPVAAPAAPRKGAPESLALLEDGAVLVGRATGADRVDLAAGTATVLVEGDAAVAVAPFGRDVLVARGARWEVRGPDGAVRAGFASPSGDALVGIAGDRAAGLVYLATLDGVTAVGADDGTVRWTESVEASGNPVLGGGLLVVPAGRGRGGDGRRDRTLTALRPGLPGFDPFDVESRRKVVALARAAGKERRDAVAFLLLDLVSSSLPEVERAELEREFAPAGPTGPAMDEPEPEDGK